MSDSKALSLSLCLMKTKLLALAGTFDFIYTGVMRFSKVMTLLHAREMQDDLDGLGTTKDERRITEYSN